MTKLGAQYINEFLPIDDRISIDDLQASHIVSMLHYRLFVFSINARDVLLSVGEQRKYSADIIWAAITGRNPVSSKDNEESKTVTALSLVLPQFTECLIRKENLKRIPLMSLHDHMKVWMGYLEFPKAIKALSKGIESKCDEIREGLEWRMLLVEELIKTIMPSFGMDPTQSLYGLELFMEKKKRLKASGGDNDDIEDSHANEANQCIETSKIDTEGMDDVDDLLDLKSDDNPTSYIRDTLLEIGNWLSSTMTMLGEIAQNPLGSGSGEEMAWRAPGTLELNTDSLPYFKDMSAGYFRVNLLQALKSPSEYVSLSNKSTDQTIEDVCIVHNIITECDRAMAFYDCFDRFYDQVSTDEDDCSENDTIGWNDREVPEKFWDMTVSRKRKSFGDFSGNDKRGTREDDNEGRSSTARRGTVKSEASLKASIFTGCKCRFSAAVDLLERYGFIKVIGNGTKIERLVFAWDT